MPATNIEAYKSPTAFAKFKKSVALELEYLPHTISTHPFKTAAVGAALVTGLSLSIGKLHDNLLDAQVKPQMLNQTSSQATASTLGVERQGTIMNGVVVKNIKDDDVAGRLINEATARYVPAGDEDIGCKVVTLAAGSKNLLSYIFGNKATVTIFNQPAFEQGGYTCQGISLEKAPAPLHVPMVYQPPLT
jgi:hypothetical protein